MILNIKGYDVSHVRINGVEHFSYSRRVESGYQICYQRLYADGTYSVMHVVAKLPYSERSDIAYDEKNNILSIAFQTKNPKDTSDVSIALVTSKNLGNRWDKA